MSTEIIHAEGIGKRYRLGDLHQHHAMLRDELARFLRRQPAGEARHQGEPFWALRDVSFSVRQGEVLGVIGTNGAGKSTLLKILSRITYPTTGKVVVTGRVGTLLEVGSGFHPELSGRENIYLNGAILGMKRREIDKQIDEIVAFAEVERFLDTPVKRYSSGMYVRLAFAVAAHLDPEILIIDEVLAVGDHAFQKKCLSKMSDISQQHGRTVLFVSHNLGSINKLCDRALLLRQGRIEYQGSTEDAIRRYLGNGSSSSSTRRFNRQTSTDLKIESIELVDEDGRMLSGDHLAGDPFRIRLTIYQHGSSDSDYLTCFLRNELGEVVLFSDSRDSESFELPDGQGSIQVQLTIPAPLLAPSTYYVSVACCRQGLGILDGYEDAVSLTLVEPRGPRIRRAGYLNVLLNWHAEAQTVGR